MNAKDKAKQLVDKYTFSCRECDNAKRRTKACFLTNDEKSTKAELSTKALLAFKPMLVAGVGY